MLTMLYIVILTLLKLDYQRNGKVSLLVLHALNDTAMAVATIAYEIYVITRVAGAVNESGFL